MLIVADTFLLLQIHFYCYRYIFIVANTFFHFCRKFFIVADTFLLLQIHFHCYRYIFYCCGYIFNVADTFLLLQLAVLRSRHFFGRLRLRMAKVPEPTPAPAPTYLGRLRLQAKRGGSRRLRLHTLKFFILSFQKGNY